jgi:hypothetical protein
MNTLLLIGTCLSGVATLIDIIGTAIPYWLVTSLGSDIINVHGNIGLFRACVDVTEYALNKCDAIGKYCIFDNITVRARVNVTEYGFKKCEAMILITSKSVVTLACFELMLI